MMRINLQMTFQADNWIQFYCYFDLNVFESEQCKFRSFFHSQKEKYLKKLQMFFENLSVYVLLISNSQNIKGKNNMLWSYRVIILVHRTIVPIRNYLSYGVHMLNAITMSITEWLTVLQNIPAKIASRKSFI